jgi:hypothetical protein
MKAQLQWARRPLTRRRMINTLAEPLEHGECLDLVTVTFNDVRLVAEQYRLLLKNLQDPFHWTVADNSPDPLARCQIRDYCEDHGLPYVDLPKSPYTRRNPSRSHGEALNYMYHKYLKPRGAAYVGFLDHDVFPVEATSVIAELNDTPVFGCVVHQGQGWYIWPGLAFFDGRFLATRNVDFNPCPGRDTGGSNFELLYSDLDVTLIDRVHRRTAHAVDEAYGEWCYEVLGRWVHTTNGSGWRANDKTTSAVLSLLETY